MTAVYTDAAAVAAALRIPPDTTLNNAPAAGSETILLASAQPSNGDQYYNGQFLAIDFLNPTLREVVQITDASVSPQLQVTPLQYAHSIGAAVKEVSAINDVVDAGSRLWDDACYTTPGAFAEQTVTETVPSQAMSDGRVLTLVTGRHITAVSAISWKYTPSSSVQTIDPTQCTFDDYQLWSWPPQSLPWAYDKSVLVTVTYTAGYNPLPGDIKRAATVLAARLYREGESGFSDVLANTELGLVQYKKGIPGDIALMVKRWRRWT